MAAAQQSVSEAAAAVPPPAAAPAPAAQLSAAVVAAQQPLVDAIQPLTALLQQQAATVAEASATLRDAPGAVTAAVTAAQQPLLASLQSLLDILEQQAASVRSPASGGGAASAALQDLARFYTDELGKASAQLGEMTARAKAAEVEVARLRALSGHEWSYALDDAEPPAARGDFSRGLRDAPLAALNVISTRLSLALKEVHEARNERVVEEHGSVHIYFLGKTPVVPVLCVDDPKQQAAAHKESEINYKTSYEQVHKRTLLQIESLHSELDVLQAESDWTPEMGAKNTEIEQLRAALPRSPADNPSSWSLVDALLSLIHLRLATRTAPAFFSGCGTLYNHETGTEITEQDICEMTGVKSYWLGGIRGRPAPPSLVRR